ncbi:RNA-binding ATPase activator esf2 [Diatrype stigma]|uniref:18S rRNA factor 2 n=1 Tax=Diatrype stigma TaxID=117547 RepID=A0AAN9UP04_9PEZI
MAPEKRNKFLDADESEDDGSQGYNSEAEELQKGGRSAKRRKFSRDDDASGSDDDDDDHVIGAEEDDDDAAAVGREGSDDGEGGKEAHENNGESIKPIIKPTELPDVSRPLTKKNLVASEKAIKKSGLIYVSRIPPYMKPTKLRQLLEPYGTINRIFLSPEDPQEHARRVKQGGNKKRMYTDGWIEFVNKKEAKDSVDLLNARTIGGPKGTYYRDDIWSLRYLKGFKWHHLTEQIAAEAAERTSRMMAEINKSTRENKEFVRNIERAKMVEGMESKAAAKKSRAEGDSKGAVSSTSGKNEDRASKSVRQFKQAAVGRKGAEKTPEEAKRVLSKLF